MKNTGKVIQPNIFEDAKFEIIGDNKAEPSEEATELDIKLSNNRSVKITDTQLFRTQGGIRGLRGKFVVVDGDADVPNVALMMQGEVIMSEIEFPELSEIIDKLEDLVGEKIITVADTDLSSHSEKVAS